MAEPKHIEIVRRAYELWHQSGQPEGRDYLQARDELSAAPSNGADTSEDRLGETTPRTLAAREQDAISGILCLGRVAAAQRGPALQPPNIGGAALHSLEESVDSVKKTGVADRSKINMHQPAEVKYWLKALDVSIDDLEKAVAKVGNSAAAVRKQLGLLGTPH